MTLTVTGRIPSKKNSRNIFVKGGRLFNLPSPKYQEWHKESTKQLKGINPIATESCRIYITIYAPDKRKADLTNKAESIMDLLVDNKIIPDDNWFVVEDIRLSFGGVEKDNPRAVIELL